MHVEALADSHRASFSGCASAIARSSGQVTLRFSRLPATRRGLRPICSIARRLVGRPCPSRACSACSEQPGAEHLRRLREPELRAVLGAGDALRAGLVLGGSLHRVGDRQREDAADLVVSQSPRSGSRGPCAAGRAAPRRAPASSRRRRRSPSRRPGRCTPNRAASRRRSRAARACRRTRSSRASANVLSSGREHHEHRLHRRHANCSHRMPQHRPARRAAVLLGRARRRCASRCRRRESGRRSTRRNESSFNSGRYNYTRFPLMHRDSLPARRRYTRLAGSADALALARLAQAREAARASSPRPRSTRSAWSRRSPGSRRSCACACCRTGRRCPTTSSRRTRTWSPSASRRSTASSAASSTSRVVPAPTAL